MKRLLALCMAGVLLAVAPAGPAAAGERTPDQMVAEARGAVREVSVAEVRRMIDAGEKFTLLDVRDRHEYEEGYIPGAVNISRGSLEFKVGLAIPDKTTRIVVYCGQDLRSPLAVRALNELGYGNAVNMAGGLKGWKAAGYPVTK